MPTAASCWSKELFFVGAKRNRRRSSTDWGGNASLAGLDVHSNISGNSILMVDESADLEEPPDRPPAALEVARRSLILSAVVCRASIESYRDEEYKRQTVEDIHEWLDE